MLELSQYDIANPVNILNSVNRNHSLNRGLANWWLCLPGLSGGQYWYDLMNKNKGTLTTMGNANNGWRGTTRKGGFGHMLFDGTAGKIAINSFSRGLLNASMSVWIKPTNVVATTYEAVFWESMPSSSSTRYGLYIFNGSALFGGRVNDAGAFQSATSPSVLTSNVWTHIGGTWNGVTGAVTIFINGVPTVGAGTAGQLGSTTAGVNAFIASDNDVGDNYPGAIDDVRFWNRALSTYEMQIVYNESRAGYPFTLNRAPTWIPSVPVNTGFQGVDVYQSQQNIVIRSLLTDNSGNKITSGATNLYLYEVQSDGALRSYDFAKNQFTSDKLVQETLPLAQQKGNAGRTDTGIWTTSLNVQPTPFVYVAPDVPGGGGGKFRRPNSVISPVLTGHELNTGLVSWWLCLPNRMSGTKWLDLCNRNHGTLQVANSTNGFRPNVSRQGAFGSILCDGSTEYVSVASSTSLSVNTGSYSLWFKAAASQNTNARLIDIGDTNNRYALFLSNSNSTGAGGYVHFFLVGGAAGAGNTLSDIASIASTYNDNSWHHVVGTWNSTNAKLYIDGALIATYSGNAVGSFPASPSLLIGEYIGTGNYYFNGSIDDVRVWNRSLSGNEVYELYKDSQAGYKKTLYRSGRRFGSTTPPPVQSLVANKPRSRHRPNIASPVLTGSPLNSGLVAWWLCLPNIMNGGKWLDLKNQTHGSLTNMTNSTNGFRSLAKKGGYGSLLFDGSAGYVNMGTSLPNTSGKLTISVWFRCNSFVNAYQVLVVNAAGSNRNYSLAIADASNLWTQGITSGVSLTIPTLSTNTWYNVVVVRNIGVQGGAGYINGKFVGSDVGATGSTAGTLTVGGNATGFSYFSGNIDDVRMWNRALSAMEIWELYKDSAAGYKQTLYSISRGHS